MFQILQVNKFYPENVNALRNVLKNKEKCIYVMIYWDECGACQSAKPIWESLAKHSFDRNVVIAMIESSYCKDMHHHAFNNVSYVPVFKCIHNGRTSEYKGERETNGFLKWIHSTASPIKKRTYTYKRLKTAYKKKKNKKKTRGKRKMK